MSWFWTVGGTMPGALDQAVGVELEYWCSRSPRGASVAPLRLRGARHDRRGRRVGRLVGVDQAQRHVAGLDQLDAAHDDRSKGLSTAATSPAARAASAARGESRSALIAKRASGPVR